MDLNQSMYQFFFLLLKYVSILVMLIVSLATGMNIHFRFYAFVNGILGDESLSLNLKKQGENSFFLFSCRFT